MKDAAYKLLDLGAKNVLIKGGHLRSETLRDIFVNRKEIVIFTNKKIKANIILLLIICHKAKFEIASVNKQNIKCIKNLY